MRFLRYFLTFLCVAGIVCGCFGAFLWLERSVIGESVLALEYRGDTLFIRSGQEQYLLSLNTAEQVAEQIQRAWILLPRNFRLSLQGLTWFCLKK